MGFVHFSKAWRAQFESAQRHKNQMTTRFTKGKARTETPRLKDLSALETARDPSEGRGGAGRFAPGNRHAIGQGFKALIRKGLGNPDDPTTGELVREATKVYLAVLHSLPSDGPGVRPLVAAQARHTTIATHLANEAVRVGLSTEQGLKLADAARAHDTTAQRLAVTAYDRAVREAAAKGSGKSSSILAAIEAAGRDVTK